MPRLNVNIDHVATIRQARGGAEPDPVAAAVLAELAGADGIVVHLREDRRHIQDRDVRILRETVKTKLNLEMAATEEMVQVAKAVIPDMITLVPEKRKELTTEGGLDVNGNYKNVSRTVRELKTSGLFVSLFIDPDLEQVRSSKEAGAQMVELHTGNFSEAANENDMESELDKIESAVNAAVEIGLRVAAGHGLNYTNTQYVAQFEDIEELNIGHSIVSRAVLVGMEKAVSDMLILCS